MRRHGLESLPILPEGRESKTPTTARLLEIFSDVSRQAFAFTKAIAALA
jgi:hypothetical protein